MSLKRWPTSQHFQTRGSFYGVPVACTGSAGRASKDAKVPRISPLILKRVFKGKNL